ncbi:hypothetical protein MKZ38_001752 [Zalerion maritima]|uniref:Uncharacterized protein n=1 Tax=Zalerion maritima TaxID=339359 RepID=A0AAD5RXM7_9PEZI|nr:hypothetical protein MKZ38_001752 [Zalerion maritima]
MAINRSATQRKILPRLPQSPTDDVAIRLLSHARFLVLLEKILEAEKDPEGAEIMKMLLRDQSVPNLRLLRDFSWNLHQSCSSDTAPASPVNVTTKANTSQFPSKLGSEFPNGNAPKMSVWLTASSSKRTEDPKPSETAFALESPPDTDEDPNPRVVHALKIDC